MPVIWKGLHMFLITKIKRIRQYQVVFHTHRMAASQSIYEASEAKKDYEQKALDAENKRKVLDE